MRGSGRDADARALSFPLIVLAQQGLVFLALRTDLGKSGFHAGEDVGTFSCSVQRARREREIHGKRVAFFSRMLPDISVQLHQVRRIPLKQLIQLGRLPLRFFFEGLAPFLMSMANGQFPGRTFPSKLWKGSCDSRINPQAHGQIQNNNSSARLQIAASLPTTESSQHKWKRNFAATS